MADNTDEVHLDIPINTQSENPPDEITPTAETETINPNQETENMEVHHHAHHEGKKNWKSYFWEFLMLFLAVFCGFLAENQREHIIEHNREKQYMQSIYNDLKKDTAFNNRFRNVLSGYYKRLDSIKNMISSRQYLADPNNFYISAFRCRTNINFETQNSAYEQIKSSGNLRLIRKKGLSDSIANYYSFIQETVNFQDSRHIQATADIAAAMWDVLDAKYYILDTLSDIKKSNWSGLSLGENTSMKYVDEQKMLKLKNLCYERMLIIRPLRNFTIDLNDRATTLLLLIKNEYHFE